MRNALAILFEFIKGLVRLVRESLSENGVGSFSRVGSAALVAGYLTVMLRGGKVPDNSEGFATVLLALYGANALRGGLTALKGSIMPQALTQPQGGANNATGAPGNGPA